MPFLAIFAYPSRSLRLKAFVFEHAHGNQKTLLTAKIAKNGRQGRKETEQLKPCLSKRRQLTVRTWLTPRLSFPRHSCSSSRTTRAKPLCCYAPAETPNSTTMDVRQHAARRRPTESRRRWR